MARPSPITGSAGSRIRVILGATGSDYLYYLDEDDGTRVWQSKDWTVADGGPPLGLCTQINSMIKKGRHITDVAFESTSGQWFVTGQKRDGTGAYQWWGGTLASGAIQEESCKVVFGPDDQWIVLRGRNGYQCSSGIDSDLSSRMHRINSRNKAINFVRLFGASNGYYSNDNEGYFISDDEGSQWNGDLGEFVGKELKNGGKDKILDVLVAGDGSWIIIRPSRITSSTGVSDALMKDLRQFYKEHQQRQQNRAHEIKVYDLAQKVLQQQQREEEQREADRQVAERREREMAERRAVERKELEMKLKRRCDEADVFRQIHTKRLKLMERVTAVGFSSEPGDAIVKSIGGDGTIEICKPLRREEGTVTIKDPRLLTPYHSEDDSSEVFTLMCFASDKYEAAISIYHCACHDGICHCTRTSTVSFLPGSIKDLRVSKSPLPPPRLVIEHANEGNTTNGTLHFDEYKCPEKINLSRLKEIVNDLEGDSNVRAHWLERLKQQEPNVFQAADLKPLQRCDALERIAKALVARLGSLPMDENGCVVYEVEYEHKDPSGRGRLFSIGESINISDDKYPRTANLQGMQKDLRVALVGGFAHDIDCANSEIRLLCSLANQLGFSALIPTIFDYRDNRQSWLFMIKDAYGVSYGDAKRLVNVIVSGGRYETWLKSVGKTGCVAAIKQFCFKLYAQIGALREQLLQHPKFKWTEVEREKLAKDGRPPGSIDRLLMPRIVQCCENEVLGMIHRTYCQNDWVVRSKVFDGLVVEPGKNACLSITEVNTKAESVCKSSGWDISLVEKPLHGLQAALPITIDEARRVIRRRGGPVY